MIRLTGVTRAALKDVRLTDSTLLMTMTMTMNHNCVEWRLTSRASLLMRIGGVQVVVH
jgi:hypothetical protein